MPIHTISLNVMYVHGVWSLKINETEVSDIRLKCRALSQGKV